MMNMYKHETAEMCRMKGWDKASIERVWMLYTEENGELASAIRQAMRYYKKNGTRKEKGMDVILELGDVFSYLFQIAYMLDIDLDDMWDKHREKVKKKMYVDT